MTKQREGEPKGCWGVLMANKGPQTKLIDLKGKALLPGFFDPHSHVVLQSAKFITANLDPKPIGNVESIADIQRILREWIQEKQLKPGQIVIGWGYDDTGLAERRHPNRKDLDAVSTENPILLLHISCHFMAGKVMLLGMRRSRTSTTAPARQAMAVTAKARMVSRGRDMMQGVCWKNSEF